MKPRLFFSMLLNVLLWTLAVVGLVVTVAFYVHLLIVLFGG